MPWQDRLADSNYCPAVQDPRPGEAGYRKFAENIPEPPPTYDEATEKRNASSTFSPGSNDDYDPAALDAQSLSSHDLQTRTKDPRATFSPGSDDEYDPAALDAQSLSSHDLQTGTKDPRATFSPGSNDDYDPAALDAQSLSSHDLQTGTKDPRATFSPGSDDEYDPAALNSYFDADPDTRTADFNSNTPYRDKVSSARMADPPPVQAKAPRSNAQIQQEAKNRDFAAGLLQRDSDFPQRYYTNQEWQRMVIRIDGAMGIAPTVPN